jgi:uncharacterized membrane protein
MTNLPPPDVDLRCPRWVKVVLAVSLALNLAVVGLVAGMMMRIAPLREVRSNLGYAAPYVIALPGQERRSLLRAIRNDPSLPRRADRKAAFKDMVNVLRLEPFDRTQVSNILNRQGADVSQIQTVAQSAWLDAVEGMSIKNRLAYIDRIEVVLSRGSRGRVKDRK